MNTETLATQGLAAETVLRQFGALCWQPSPENPGAIEVLLVTSSAGNWILPKGRPVKGTDGAGSAAQEAWEEAGVKGEIGPCLGVVETRRAQEDGRDQRCAIEIHAIRVAKLAKKFPEAKRRKRRWLALSEAPAAVANPDLSAFLKSLDPQTLAG